MKFRKNNKIKYRHMPGGSECIGIPHDIEYQVIRRLRDPDAFVLVSQNGDPLIVTGLRAKVWMRFDAAVEDGLHAPLRTEGN